jgi:hypothetical protein
VGLAYPWGCTAAALALCSGVFPRREKWAGPPCRTQVILIHGGSRAKPATAGTGAQAGRLRPRPNRLNPVTATMRSAARGLWTTCHEAMEAAGSDHLRFAVQHMGLAAVSVAAPHQGTPLASLGWAHWRGISGRVHRSSGTCDAVPVPAATCGGWRTTPTAT